MHRLLYISEQYRQKKLNHISDYLKSVLVEGVYNKFSYHNPEVQCFQLVNNGQQFFADTNYFVGVDWIVKGKAAVYIEPKLNDTQQVDFLGMLLQSLDATENTNHLDGLFHVEYEEPWINIPMQKDLLSPILIVQFLKLVQRIVRKGLKKSYYRVTENLDSRVKGKILVSEQIKNNVVKNRHTKTICNYLEHGVNIPENQFLKLILKFVYPFLSPKNSLFTPIQIKQLKDLLHYCQPSFEQVNILKDEHQKIIIKPNSLYKEYQDAIRIGEYILKRFSFNINKIREEQTSTPPFWIDMSKLFELYVFEKLKKIFPKTGDVTYHDKFKGGKETDILIRTTDFKCIVDCKYKPHYDNHSPSLEDKRQLAGYTRLKSAYNKLSTPYYELVRGLIIYSHQNFSETILKEDLFETPIEEYVEFYKLGVRLPEVLYFD